LLNLAGLPIWIRSLEALQASPWISRVVVVVRACDRSEIEPIANEMGASVVEGGAERFDSVRCGLDHLRSVGDTSPFVAIHDAARPLVTSDDIDAVVGAAMMSGAAILATPVRGTIKRLRLGHVSTVPRSELWEALTPQVFAMELIRQAYDRHRGSPATDDAELIERCGVEVRLVPGSADNLKITNAEDLRIAEAMFASR